MASITKFPNASEDRSTKSKNSPAIKVLEGADVKRPFRRTSATGNTVTLDGEPTETALGPAVMVEVGMNKNVAVVAVALTEDVR